MIALSLEVCIEIGTAVDFLFEQRYFAPEIFNDGKKLLWECLDEVTLL